MDQGVAKERLFEIITSSEGKDLTEEEINSLINVLIID